MRRDKDAEARRSSISVPAACPIRRGSDRRVDTGEGVVVSIRLATPVSRARSVRPVRLQAFMPPRSSTMRAAAEPSQREDSDGALIVPLRQYTREAGRPGRQTSLRTAESWIRTETPRSVPRTAASIGHAGRRSSLFPEPSPPSRTDAGGGEGSTEQRRRQGVAVAVATRAAAPTVTKGRIHLIPGRS